MTNKERRAILEKDFADDFPMVREEKAEDVYWHIKDCLVALFCIDRYEYPTEYKEAQEEWNHAYKTASENKKAVMLDMLNEWREVKKVRVFVEPY